MPLRSFLFVALLVTALPVLAQESIRSQMSADDFRAAGLEKLDAAELARLDAWLNRTIVTESEKAAVAATNEVKKDARGFLDFGTSEPIEGRIAGDFRGYGRGREYTLEDGTVWRQIDDAQLASARLQSPAVRISPSLVGNAWYMSVEGYNTKTKVQRIK